MRWSLLLVVATTSGCACIPVNDLICKKPMEIAEKSYSEGNCSSARINWTREAHKGNAAAQNNMALIWENGCIVEGFPEWSIPQNYTAAYDWLMLAATNGEPTAVFNLGRYHENGFAVEKNLEKAITWYTLAARKGNEPARLRLTALGKSVPPSDLIDAIAVHQPTIQPGVWRDLGEWIIAFAGAYVLGAAQEYQRPPTPSTVNVDVRAHCRTRIIGDIIKTDCY